MTNKLRVALLGLEQPHADLWQGAFQESPHSELVGAWTQTSGLAQSKAERFGYVAWDDRDALINASDAVAVCSVTSQHLEIIEAVAAKGKSILCEKPIATSIDHCNRIQAVIEETGAFYMQGFPKRFDPINHEVKRIVESGDLGTISLVRIRHGHPVAVLNPNFRETWFVEPELGGGGAMMDEGVHAADFIRWFFGEPEETSCFLTDKAQGFPVEDTGVAIFRFGNGMLAEIASCWHFMAAQNSIEIFGTTGSVVVSGVDLGSRDLTNSEYLKYYIHPSDPGVGGDALGPMDRKWTISKTTPQFKINTEVFHKNVARAFIDAVVNGKEPPVNVIDGRRAVEMILAAYKSAETGRVEKISYG